MSTPPLAADARPLDAADSRPAHTEVGITGQAVTTRVLSLDIFRGFTMAVMIFVNDIGEMGGLPAWTHHYPAQVDAMSYVDMVYPFFLFAVGLSLPLAIRQRLRRDPSIPGLWLHILSRVVALVVLGLLIANQALAYAPAMHMRGSTWALFGLLGGILFLNVYPRSRTPASRSLVLILRAVGLVTVLGLLAIFRRQLPNGHLAWIDFSYPEILGLIGLTYLGVCLLYIPTRRLRWAPLVWLVVLVAFNAACCAHWITSPVNTATLYAFPFDNGAMASLVMAGIVVSGFFLPPSGDRSATETSPPSAVTAAAPGSLRPVGFYDSALAPGAHRPSETDILARSNLRPAVVSTPGEPAVARRAFTSAIVFAVVTALLGLALKPLGISKIRATPSWALWSIAAATLVFALFFYLLDIRRRTVWSAPFRAPGANTLLTYLLPDLFYFLTAALHLNFLFTHFNYGLPGVLRAFCFTGVMLFLSYLVTRAKLRLQL